jgi:hypothetical protein
VLRKVAALDARRRALVAYGLGWVVISKAVLAVPGGTLPRRQRSLDVTSELRIGVAADGRGAIRAHAWVDASGETWSWGEAGAYSVLRPHATGS